MILLCCRKRMFFLYVGQRKNKSLLHHQTIYILYKTMPTNNKITVFKVCLKNLNLTIKMFITISGRQFNLNPKYKVK